MHTRTPLAGALLAGLALAGGASASTPGVSADVVLVDGKPCAKVGRELRPNPRLELVA